MTEEFVLKLNDPRATVELAGGKGASLARLSLNGLPVPDGFHVTTRAYSAFIEANQLQPEILALHQRIDLHNPASLEEASQAMHTLFSNARIPPEVAQAITSAYTALPGTYPAVAVRSSATAEDLPEASFAGQHETSLNMRGEQAVLQAVVRCWASLFTSRAIGYRARKEIPTDNIALAVVVQLLVPAQASGILFTVNPLDGDTQTVMINAAWGLGEAIVSGQVTPDSITVEKSTGHILERQTSLKTVMTVCKDEGTETQAVPDDLRLSPMLTDDLVVELVGLAVRIEELYQVPMDIEWALVDEAFTILQARPITALPEWSAPIPEGWPLPDPKGHYARASITELMPNPLSPLFATLGLSNFVQGMKRTGEELVHMPQETIPENYFCTINQYAYLLGSYTPREIWLMLRHLLPAVPRLMREGVAYWQQVARPAYLETARKWEGQNLAELSPRALLEGINEIVAAHSRQIGALMLSTMGPAAGSEVLFTRIYEKMVMRKGDPPASTFLMGFDSLPILGEKALFDLAEWCRSKENLAAFLVRTDTTWLAENWQSDASVDEVPPEDWSEWQWKFNRYLERYGYSIYDLDFSQALPMDHPLPMLETLKLFIEGKGRNPYERQGEFEQKRLQAVQSLRQRLKGIKKWAFNKSLGWAQTLAPLREDGISEIGLGYPILRRMFSELGDRLVLVGCIQQAKDIYWLEEADLQNCVEDLQAGAAAVPMVDLVSQRKRVNAVLKKRTPPPHLPPNKKYMGFDLESTLAMRSESAQGEVLQGVGASGGKVTAPARVLLGPGDFSQMQPGEILVASITTPAWTPLFTLASGVVTDIGGPLSHSSIVAREYGIPAVLGTGVAARRIRNGQTITVDGDAGTVTLES